MHVQSSFMGGAVPIRYTSVYWTIHSDGISSRSYPCFINILIMKIKDNIFEYYCTFRKVTLYETGCRMLLLISYLTFCIYIVVY